MKEKITISMENCYNMQAWEKALIEKCMNDNPTFNQDEIAKLLGISERTLIRKVQELNIDNCKIKRMQNMMMGIN